MKLLAKDNEEITLCALEEGKTEMPVCALFDITGNHHHHLASGSKPALLPEKHPGGKIEKNSTCTKMLQSWGKAFPTIGSQGLKTACLIR